jgi:hypothetical protein
LRCGVLQPLTSLGCPSPHRKRRAMGRGGRKVEHVAAYLSPDRPCEAWLRHDRRVRLKSNGRHQHQLASFRRRPGSMTRFNAYAVPIARPRCGASWVPALAGMTERKQNDRWKPTSPRRRPGLRKSSRARRSRGRVAVRASRRSWAVEASRPSRQGPLLSREALREEPALSPPRRALPAARPPSLRPVWPRASLLQA